MNLDPVPRQSKLIYLAIDAGLLVTAFIIVYFSKQPFAPLPFVSAVLCVVLAAVVGLVPFLTDYAADSAEYVQMERGRVADQVQRLHVAVESLNRAAAQIKAVEEAVHKTAHAAENLPYRMQEKLAEFNEALATKDTDEREALERELDELRATNSDNLKAVADKIARAAAEWSVLETAARKQLSAAQAATAKLNDQLQATLTQLDARIAALGSSSVKAAEDKPATVQPADAKASTSEALANEGAPARPEPVEGVIETVTLSETSSLPTEEPKPKKARAPRKPKPEDPLTAMSADLSAEGPAMTESTPAENVSAATTEPAAAASAESVEPAPMEASISSDGATRLLVTAYIGIGNKLYLRGDGPGLSLDKGVPMQFVSIGKWGWDSNDVTAPITCKLYKNDETAALSGEISLEPGKHTELTALF